MREADCMRANCGESNRAEKCVGEHDDHTNRKLSHMLECSIPCGQASKLNRRHNQTASAHRQLGSPVVAEIQFDAERHISQNVEGVAHGRRLGRTARADINALQ
jgi:hypothetical protein